MLDHAQAVALEADDRPLALGQEDHVLDAEVLQDLRADAVVAQRRHPRRGMAEPRLDPIRDAGRRGLADQHHDAAAGGVNLGHRRLQHAGPAVVVLAEHVLQDIERMHPHEHRARRLQIALDQRDVLHAGQHVGVHLQAEVAGEAGVQRARDVALDQLVVAQPVRDQIGDLGDLEAVALGEGDQIRQARHGAVVVHDLADHAGRVEPGEPRDVDRRLGVAGAHQHAAVARHQREDVAGRGQIGAGRAGVDRHLDGARPVGRRDAGGDALARLDAHGERGRQARFVALRHQRQAELLDPLAGQRQADQAAAVLGHEVDLLGVAVLGRDHEVAFVLAALVVDQDEHLAALGDLDDLLDRAEILGERHGVAPVLRPARRNASWRAT